MIKKYAKILTLLLAISLSSCENAETGNIDETDDSIATAYEVINSSNKIDIRIPFTHSADDDKLFYCAEGKVYTCGEESDELIYAPESFEVETLDYDSGKLYGWDFDNEQVWAYDLATGSESYAKSSQDDLPYIMFAADGRVFLEFWYFGAICSYSMADGSELIYDLPRGELSYCDGMLYSCTVAGEVYRTPADRSEPEQLEVEIPKCKVEGFYLMPDGSMLFATDIGVIESVDGKYRTVSFDRKVENILFVHGGRLYGTCNGGIYSFDIATGSSQLEVEKYKGMCLLVGDLLCDDSEDGVEIIKKLE